MCYKGDAATKLVAVFTTHDAAKQSAVWTANFSSDKNWINSITVFTSYRIACSGKALCL